MKEISFTICHWRKIEITRERAARTHDVRMYFHCSSLIVQINLTFSILHYNMRRACLCKNMPPWCSDDVLRFAKIFQHYYALNLFIWHFYPKQFTVKWQYNYTSSVYVCVLSLWHCKSHSSTYKVLLWTQKST